MKNRRNCANYIFSMCRRNCKYSWNYRCCGGGARKPFKETIFIEDSAFFTKRAKKTATDPLYEVPPWCGTNVPDTDRRLTFSNSLYLIFEYNKTANDIHLQNVLVRNNEYPRGSHQLSAKVLSGFLLIQETFGICRLWW